MTMRKPIQVYDPPPIVRKSKKRKEIPPPEEYTVHDGIESLAYITHKEADMLQALARALPSNPIIVNIGAGNGTSTLAFMQSRADAQVYSIDITYESHPYGCLVGERAHLALAGLGDSPRYHQIHDDSKEAGRRWFQEQRVLVDMVFVDGDHSYEGAKGDIEIWRELIKPGGIMAIHDFEKIEKVWHTVDKAVRDVFGDKPVLMHVDTTIAYKVNE